VYVCLGVFVYKNYSANSGTKMSVIPLFISQKLFTESVERTFGNHC